MPDVDINAPVIPTSGITVRTNENHAVQFDGDTIHQSQPPGVSRYVAGDEQRDAAARGDVLRSAVNAQGSPIPPSKIDGDSIVTVSGIQARVDDLEACGVLVKEATGYRMATAQETSATKQQQATQQEQAPKMEPLPQEAEADVAKFAATVGTGAQIAAIAEVARDGALSAHTAGQIASQLGVEPAQAQEIVAQLHAHFAEQAAGVISGEGIEPDALLSWAREHHANALSDAMRSHAMQRSTSGYRQLCTSYFASLDTIDPESVLSAQLGDGVKVQQQDGRIFVRTSDGQFSWPQAVKLGLIKLGKAK